MLYSNLRYQYLQQNHHYLIVADIAIFLVFDGKIILKSAIFDCQLEAMNFHLSPRSQSRKTAMIFILVASVATITSRRLTKDKEHKLCSSFSIIFYIRDVQSPSPGPNAACGFSLKMYDAIFPFTFWWQQTALTQLNCKSPFFPPLTTPAN